MSKIKKYLIDIYGEDADLSELEGGENDRNEADK